MANMSLKKNPMPSQEPDVRNKNFDEVALGYTEEMAIDEAKRCLNCKNPKCVNGCPVNVHIPEFIAKVAEGKFDEAFGVITSTNSLPAICGRVCPQENQCEGQCIRGIKGEPVGIGRLERFVADYHNAHGHQGGAPAVPESNGHKVAVVGSGPAGLTCAGDLARKGYDVTVFEALHQVGGVLVYGIPEFRLPKAIVAKEVARLEHFGVKIMTDTVVGRTITVDELMDEMGFEAVFIGSGAGLPMFMNIPGVNYKGVLSANEFLTRINLMKAYLPDSDTPLIHPKKVAVVGGGNVAMDAARCAKRLGAEVYVVYRRGMEELPARREEVEHAEEEGIIFKTLCNPVEVLADENDDVKGIRCIREFDVSSATVELAAVAVGVEPARIAKTLSFKLGEDPILVVTAGDAKIDNSKYKHFFGMKAKMLTPEEAVERIGHAVGGVCPFALPEDVKTYLDLSLRRFDTVFPAVGSAASAIELTCGELERCCGTNFVSWVDVCKGWQEETDG